MRDHNRNYERFRKLTRILQALQQELAEAKNHTAAQENFEIKFKTERNQKIFIFGFGPHLKIDFPRK